MKSKTVQFIQWLQSHVQAWWYGPFIGVLAAVDNIVLFVPNDGILISSCMLVPKKWLQFTWSIALGSTFGAILLYLMVYYFGTDFILWISPDLMTSSAWVWTDQFFDQYGIWIVFAVAISPVLQQPAVVLAALASVPILEVMVVVFIGRIIKFMIMGYIASHAPQYLGRLWGIDRELKEVGIETGRN